MASHGMLRATMRMTFHEASRENLIEYASVPSAWSQRGIDGGAGSSRNSSSQEAMARVSSGVKPLVASAASERYT